jgi:hypothetical protein
MLRLSIVRLSLGLALVTSCSSLDTPRDESTGGERSARSDEISDSNVSILSVLNGDESTVMGNFGPGGGPYPAYLWKGAKDISATIALNTDGNGAVVPIVNVYGPEDGDNHWGKALGRKDGVVEGDAHDPTEGAVRLTVTPGSSALYLIVVQRGKAPAQEDAPPKYTLVVTRTGKCTPHTCTDGKKNYCGSTDDGCGHPLDCPADCANSGEVCGGGDEPNVCSPKVGKKVKFPVGGFALGSEQFSGEAKKALLAESGRWKEKLTKQIDGLTDVDVKIELDPEKDVNGGTGAFTQLFAPFTGTIKGRLPADAKSDATVKTVGTAKGSSLSIDFAYGSWKDDCDAQIRRFKNKGSARVLAVSCGKPKFMRGSLDFSLTSEVTALVIDK